MNDLVVLSRSINSRQKTAGVKLDAFRDHAGNPPRKVNQDN